MQAILYVSHGTRLKEGQQEAESFIYSIKEHINVPLQEICFLELASPTIEEGVARLVNSGATSISVVPMLLLSAKHYYHDIPEKLEKVKNNFTDIHFTYGSPLNVQDRIINVLKERIYEQKPRLNSDVKILLVGRGSYEPQIKEDIEHIANKLEERIGIGGIETCYLAACKPSFKETLSQAMESNCSQVVVVPYLWFNGLLIQSLRKKQQNREESLPEIIVCDQLGDHPIMQKAFIERVYESFHND